jgi:DNA-binding LacI/PurR family transcriptional regulator
LGTAAARALLQQADLPTAVLASNDRSAVRVLDAFVRAGLDVPAVVSVVGYDDSALSRLAHVNLATVRQDVERMAELAVEAVIERLDQGRTSRRDSVLSPHLVVRGTSGPPRLGASPLTRTEASWTAVQTVVSATRRARPDAVAGAVSDLLDRARAART